MKRKAVAVARYGVMLAMILALGLVERQFPLVPGVPGIRLGLSNAVILYALFRMSARGAWALTLLKALLGGALYAGVAGALYSLGGGACAILGMQLLLRVKGMGLVGVSVGGACLHSVGQLLVSRPLIGTWAAVLQAPLLLVASVIAGALTGVLCNAVIRAMSAIDPG